MINTMGDTVDAWYAKLSGSISVPVFIESVPEDVSGHYVLLRAESETDNSTKSYYGKIAVVIVDIITEFQYQVNTRKADDIDGEISALILPAVGTHGLTVSGFQINKIIPESSTYLQQDDGTRKYYRKIIRYNHIINE